MALVTLVDLRIRARTRADMTGSEFVTNDELTQWVNEAADELYEILVLKFGEDYFATSYDFATVANVETVALPAGVFKVLGVDLRSSSASQWVSLARFSFAERNAQRGNLGAPAGAPRYRLEGSNLRLLPAPTGVLSGKLWYVPQRTPLAADGDTLDGVSGWEAYVVADAARKALLKEESDTSALVQELAQLRDRIERAAANRDAGQPAKLVDTDRPFYGDDPIEDW